MGDAAEGLIDADARIQERLEERERERTARKTKPAAARVDPEQARQLESCRLARTELQRQAAATAHPTRQKQIKQALAELDRRIKQLSA